MANRNYLEKTEMDQYCKGAWLACEHEKQSKSHTDPLELLAEQSRKKAEIEERKKLDTISKPNTNIQLVKVIRDLHNGHPLDSGYSG